MKIIFDEHGRIKEIRTMTMVESDIPCKVTVGPVQMCGDCTEKGVCCAYSLLVKCFGEVRADNFRCVMDNEER